MNKVDKYLTEKMRADKRVEVKIIMSVPENIHEKHINSFIKKKFKYAIEQGGVLSYNIKVL